MSSLHAEVTLPYGLWQDGRHYRDAVLAPLAPEDELAIADLSDAATPAERVTLVLARALARLGPFDAVGPAETRRLTAGDREALLLSLRALTSGDVMRCLLACPTCGERLEIDVSARELLVEPYPDTGPWFDVRVTAAGEPCVVRFRLPDGGDLERAARASLATADHAAVELVLGCTESARRESDGAPAELAVETLSRTVADAMAERDPQAEVVLDLACPACEERFPTLLDAGSIVLQELGERAARLSREVHLLAFHYHWRERDILAVPAGRRRRYVALLAETLGAGRGG